jgi:hypothetical protein
MFDEPEVQFRMVVVNDNVYVRLEDVIVALNDAGVSNNLGELFNVADELLESRDDIEKLYTQEELNDRS